MESVIRNVRDIDGHERQALEHVLGRQLKENQRVIIQVVTVDNESSEKLETGDETASTHLPNWCAVFAGLTDKQVAEVEKVILQRLDLSRPIK